MVGRSDADFPTDCLILAPPASLLITDEEQTCDNPEVFADPTVGNGLVSPRQTSAQPPPRLLRCETEGKEESAAEMTIHVPLHVTEQIVILDPKVIGIPDNENWDESRFCFEHEQMEWLLSMRRSMDASQRLRCP